MFFSICFLSLHTHRLAFQKVVWGYHGDTAQLRAAGSEAQILLNRFSEERGTEYFVSRGHKHHPQHWVFADMVTTMRYIGAHKLNVGFDPCMSPAPLPLRLTHSQCWGECWTLLRSSMREVASRANTWPFDQLHVNLRSMWEADVLWASPHHMAGWRAAKTSST